MCHRGFFEGAPLYPGWRVKQPAQSLGSALGGTNYLTCPLLEPIIGLWVYR